MSDPREGSAHWTKRMPERLWWRGEAHPSSKLKRTDVEAMRTAYYETNESARSLSRRFGVCPRTVREIVTYQKWKDA